MRKTLAYFSALFGLFTLGIVVLHPSYRALADWLGPTLGSHIYTLFTLIYLLLADPIRYPLVTMVWVFLGLLIGVITGKRLGASLTALLVWLTTVTLLAASVAGIYFSLEARGVFNGEIIDAISVIPVIPEQLTLNSFFQIPIISEIILQMVEIAPTINENMDPMRLAINMAMPYLIAVLSKPVIMIVCAIIGATISGIVFSTVGGLLPSRGKTMAVLMVFALLSPMSGAYAMNLDDGIYAEAVGGYIEEQNRAILGELLIGNTVEVLPTDTSEASGLVASIVFTQKVYEPSILYSLPIDGITDILNFRNIAPSTFAVNVYLGTDESIEEKSNTLVSTIESNLGITLHHIAAVPMPYEEGSENGLPEMTAVLYYSENTIEETTANILEPFSSEGGFSDLFSEKLNGNPLDLEFYATGVIHIEPLEAMIPLPDIPEEYQDEYETLINSRFSFFAGVQLKEEAAEPLGNSYRFDLLDTLDVQNPPDYAADSDASLLILARSNNTGVTDLMDPTVYIKTSLPENSIELNLLTMYLQELGTFIAEAGEITVLDTVMTVPELHPPEIELRKTTQSTSNGLQVTISATNNGENAVTNLSLLDSFPVKYGELVSGTPEATWSSLNPGETKTLSYTVELDYPGTYTDTPAVLHFTSNDFPSSAASNINPVIEKTPNPISMLGDCYSAITSVLDLVTNEKGDMLGLGILGFVVLIVIIDVIRYFSGRSKNDASPEEEQVPHTPPESPEDNHEDPL